MSNPAKASKRVVVSAVLIAARAVNTPRLLAPLSDEVVSCLPLLAGLFAAASNQRTLIRIDITTDTA